MARAIISFQRLIQDSQDFGSDEEHMISRVFFDLEFDGKKLEGLCADIKQSVGSSFVDGPLEVSAPLNYHGPFNHETFRAAAEHYYRGLVGPQGRGIRISGGGAVRMRHNVFEAESKVSLDISAAGGGW